MTQNNKKAIIYCRVSTKKQEKDWDSLENQEKVCRKYCKNNNIQVIWVYKEAFTWKKKDRPIFNESINSAINNKVNYFIIYDIDRFSREWYWVYSDLKNNLFKYWIELRDSKNIIQSKKPVIENELVDMSQYNWNLENSSEYAEVILSTQAQIEGKKIIQRTIPREIELEQMWYKTRQSNFWFLNKKIKTNFGKATIQIKDPIEWEWIIEIFEKRANWNYSDSEIVEILNNKWFKTRRNYKLTIKHLQEYIKNTIYCWILVSKWTWYKPIKTPYEWLVSIDLWNKANKWKIKIIEIDKKEFKIIYNNKNESSIDKPIIKKRKRYNPFFCYSKILKCPICNKHLIWSSSRWRNWSLHHYYFCKWKRTKTENHPSYSLKRDEVHKNILNIFKNIEINDKILKLYDSIIENVYKERKNELETQIINYKNRIKELTNKEQEIIKNIDNIINFPHLLEIKNKELENIKTEILKLSKISNINKNSISLEKFKYYSKKVITQLDKLVIQTEKPELINIAFNIVFHQERVYDNIISQTIWKPEFSSILKQKKSSKIENFSKMYKWQSNSSIKRTNLSNYLYNQFNLNLDNYKEQFKVWYKLFEYSLNKGLFNFK